MYIYIIYGRKNNNVTIEKNYLLDESDFMEKNNNPINAR